MYKRRKILVGALIAQESSDESELEESAKKQKVQEGDGDQDSSNDPSPSASAASFQTKTNFLKSLRQEKSVEDLELDDVLRDSVRVNQKERHKQTSTGTRMKVPLSDVSASLNGPNRKIMKVEHPKRADQLIGNQKKPPQKNKNLPSPRDDFFEEDTMENSFCARRERAGPTTQLFAFSRVPSKKSFRLYDALGLSRDALEPEIKKAYKRRITEVHPDKGGSEEEFLRVRQAFQILSDGPKRRSYDTLGDAFLDLPEALQGLSSFCEEEEDSASRVDEEDEEEEDEEEEEEEGGEQEGGDTVGPLRSVDESGDGWGGGDADESVRAQKQRGRQTAMRLFPRYQAAVADTLLHPSTHDAAHFSALGALKCDRSFALRFQRLAQKYFSLTLPQELLAMPLRLPALSEFCVRKERGKGGGGGPARGMPGPSGSPPCLAELERWLAAAEHEDNPLPWSSSSVVTESEGEGWRVQVVGRPSDVVCDGGQQNGSSGRKGSGSGGGGKLALIFSQGGAEMFGDVRGLVASRDRQRRQERDRTRRPSTTSTSEVETGGEGASAGFGQTESLRGALRGLRERFVQSSKVMVLVFVDRDDAPVVDLMRLEGADEACDSDFAFESCDSEAASSSSSVCLSVSSSGEEGEGEKGVKGKRQLQREVNTKGKKGVERRKASPLSVRQLTFQERGECMSSSSSGGALGGGDGGGRSSVVSLSNSPLESASSFSSQTVAVPYFIEDDGEPAAKRPAPAFLRLAAHTVAALSRLSAGSLRLQTVGGGKRKGKGKEEAVELELVPSSAE
uniref:J domain-containing protein n=1 Tax=Chromera velia CCMP2878 TaxID=1169474 RepID=A0A0G4HKB0_9ALVE|eukprot:Cvel_28415.t1-p1 / transcript=Cvel_28415.t1 / gene=Cvel_28415 / organism=Chromera_velia_CCMP2878 / gene_product=Chaperone protein dnaJ 3, putative / transcript_product=Chaperone protein dnaJ 3, putative / location=Cvel_scaffold3715:6855-9224(-) / protein_length=790 / sequence_SO=supercontig / SO=protein_coding / is_pseudo=false